MTEAEIIVTRRVNFGSLFSFALQKRSSLTIFGGSMTSEIVKLKIEDRDEFYEFLEMHPEYSIMKTHQESVELFYEMKKKDTLQCHERKMWQGKGSDKRWRTYVYIDGKRKVICKNTKEELEETIIKLLKEEENEPLVSDIYKLLIEEKKKIKQSDGTIERYDRLYSTYLSDFSKMKIRSITPRNIKELFIRIINDHSQKEEHKLTRKEFSNMKGLVKLILLYAKSEGYISWLVSQELEDISGYVLNDNVFKKIKHTNEELVFSDEDIVKLKDVINTWGYDILNLAILLDFKIGCRPGELVALKYTDIVDDKVYITRTEVSRRDKEGHTHYEIKLSPKTEAGDRAIPLPGDKNESLWIINMARAINPEGEYLFMQGGKRINQKQLRDRMARLCKKAGIVRKSPNKVRKTYASMLHENMLPDSTIQTVMGHSDITTTQKYYIKNRMSDDQISNQMQQVNI